MIDFSTRYLGLKLNGPIVVSSTPLSESLDNVRRMEDAGASAIVLTSLFEEQLALESRTLDEDLSRGTDSFAESLDFLPEQDDYRMTHEVYLEYLRRAKSAVNIPILASLNGATVGGWVRFAREMEQAGADAIELNTYALATDRSPDLQRTRAATSRTRRAESVSPSRYPSPSSCRNLSPSLPHLVTRLQDVGARGIVLFNRFYQPDFDIETLEVRPTLHFSTPSELLPRLHWAATVSQLAGCPLILIRELCPAHRGFIAMSGSSRRPQRSYDSTMPYGLKRFQKAEALHFITFSCFHRLPFLEAPATRKALSWLSTDSVASSGQGLCLRPDA